MVDLGLVNDLNPEEHLEEEEEVMVVGQIMPALSVASLVIIVMVRAR